MSKMNDTLDGSLKDIQAYVHGDKSRMTTEKLPLTIHKAPQYQAKDIKTIRHKISVTQKVLAYIMDVSPRTVEAWEDGNSRPDGSARRLLQIINDHPKLVDQL